MFTDAEMISDSYDLKEVDGVVYEANGAMITIGAVNAGEFSPLSRPPAVAFIYPLFIIIIIFLFAPAACPAGFFAD